MTLDTHADLCQSDVITVPVSSKGEASVVKVMPAPDRTKNKRGRPRITTERPWDAQGISRSTYYERIKPALPTQISYATDIPRWFCIRLHHLTNDAVLEVDTAIRKAGFETFYPQIWVPPVAARRTETGRAIPATSERLVPLLRSYALVRFDRTDQSWRRLAAFGQVLGAPEWPTPIPDADIKNLRDGLAVNGVLYPPKPPAASNGVKKRWVDMATALLALVGAE